jgi:hypothetical protein
MEHSLTWRKKYMPTAATTRPRDLRRCHQVLLLYRTPRDPRNPGSKLRLYLHNASRRVHSMAARRWWQ